MPPEPDFDGPHLTFSNLFPSNYQFGGPHSGVLLTVLCDGSVQGINYSIDEQTFRYLSNREDGKAFTLNE